MKDSEAFFKGIMGIRGTMDIRGVMGIVGILGIMGIMPNPTSALRGPKMWGARKYTLNVWVPKAGP